MNLTILGGGIAGVVAAKYAKDRGINEVCLIEKDTKLGGLHKDIEIDNIHYDIGAFFFDSSHTVLNIFQIKEIMQHISPFSCFSLTNKGNLDMYPVTIRGYIKEWGLESFCLDIFSLFYCRLQLFLNFKQVENVEDDLSFYFGNFYEKTGLKNYVQRLYGMPPSEINLQFTGKRLGYVKDALRFDKILKKIISLRFGELNKWRIAPAIYARPNSGFSRMYSHIHEELNKNDVDLYFGEQIQKILIEKKEIITQNDKVYTYDNLLSSIPLGLLCKLCGVQLNLKLEYKPLYSIFYVCEEEPIEDCHVLFNFSEGGFWKRVTFHSGYYKNEPGKHYFTVESIPNEMDLKDPNIVSILDSDFKLSFAETNWSGQFKNAKLVGSHLTLNAYPIYKNDFDFNALEEIKQYFASKSIYLVGRQGEFDYVSSSDAALSSIKAVDKILSLEQ